MIKRVECTARGRVQGVGYRLYVVGQANACRINGWVRNEPDGTVRVVAEGEESALEEFVKRIKQNKFLQRVDSLAVSRSEAVEGFENFGVRY